MQQGDPTDERVAVRQNRRWRWNSSIVAPLRGAPDDDEIERLVSALAFGWGPEAAISLVDVAELDTETAKHTMLLTCRWILRRAIQDAQLRSRTGISPR